jgi:hypothetical protein
MTATITATLQLELTTEQAQLLHAVLSDATNTLRERQLFWLKQHEALASTSPVMSGQAWEAFKAWERKETQAVQAIDAIRATGLELRFSDHGIASR